MKRCVHCGFEQNFICTNHHPIEVEESNKPMVQEADKPEAFTILIQIFVASEGA